MDIKISIIDICYANTARYLKLLWFLYFINEKFNKNAKVEKLTKKLGTSVRLIVKGPYFLCIYLDEGGWGGGALMHVYVLEHIVSLCYRTAWWIFTKLGKDEVLMARTCG